ncbi:MAG: two-component regulator propeller domain-containing protein [Ferruginibacter sp.]
MILKTIKYISRLFLLFIAVLVPYCGKTQNIQRYNSFSYSVNEGLLQTTISDIAFDKNNFCWIGFPNGIQKFDGKNFSIVPVQAGLPDDKKVLFLKCNNGDLFISHSQGISKYEINSNKFIQVYTQHDKKTPSQFIGDDNGIIYFSSEQGVIMGLDCHSFKVVSETNTGLRDTTLSSEYRGKPSSNIINHKVAMEFASRLYLWDLKAGKMLFESQPVENISHYLLTLKNENEVLHCTYKINNALQVYNFATGINKMLFIKGKDAESISRCIIHPWQKKLLISFSNHLYETDSALLVLKSELVNFQNQPVAGKASIFKIIEDNFGNLVLATVSSGIRKIIRNNYPIKYYGTEKKEDNNVLGLLVDKKNNRILAGTAGNGLLIFDSLQRLVKTIGKLPGSNKSFYPNTIIKINKGDYLLFCAGEKNIWRLSYDLSKMDSFPIRTSLPEERRYVYYFGNHLYQNEQEVVSQSQGSIYHTNLTNKTVTQYDITNSYTMSGLFFNNVIITHANDELIFIDTATFREIRRISFENTGSVRCFAKNDENNFFIGSNKGVYKVDINGKILLHLKKENGLPDECIYAMAFDDDGFLWCSTNKGIIKINKDNSIFQLKKEDGLQENEFNTNVVSKAEDGEMFFGGVNGVSSFYPSTINSFEEKIALLVIKITINNEPAFKDTAVWNIKKIDLPYDQNTLSFDFIAMANNNPGQYVYQYKMDGIDKEWIQNNDMQTVSYHLPPGKYVFKIHTSRTFNSEATAMKEIFIWIHPPFWKTWWFISSMALLCVLALAYSINRYNRNKYQQKVAELESEHKVQLERERISRDLHDNIGAYANTVIYKTELLQKEVLPGERNELMNDLRYASKDIITSLRETIWALKKEQYDAQECFVRIRNFVQPFSRYYPNIRFSIDGEVPAAMKLHYTKALNLVRIIQEAVSNSIKHAAASEINIKSAVENERWKLIVSDNGTGFEYEGTRDLQQGNGLDNMKLRASDSGFNFNIESGEDKGTSITIFV